LSAVSPFAKPRKAFSQALFLLLAIPEVASDASANLTMHQILRLLYSNQLSPVENLFRFESQFDRPILRDAIGRLPCRDYDPILYENEVRIRELRRALRTRRLPTNLVYHGKGCSRSFPGVMIRNVMRVCRPSASPPLQASCRVAANRR
jgi:hypothetical protein